MSVTEPQAIAAGPVRDVRRELILLLMVVAALSVTSGVFEPSLNNFLNDTFHIGAERRGILEFPRELPGFLVAILGGLLFFLSEIRIGVLATSALALGLAGLALIGDRSYAVMIICLVTWSVGSHMMIPVTSTITLSLAAEGKRASRMGQVGAIGGAATILGSGLVWVGMRWLHLSYTALFLVAGSFALCASVLVSRFHPLPHRGGQRPKLVLKRRYSLYYLLCTFSGARKQVFITFGPWVLIKIFHQPAYMIALLYMIASAVNVVFQPALGRLIDRWGERRILMLDAVMLIGVCTGYGFSRHQPWLQPVYIAYVCYVLDNVLFACSMARATYLDKIAENKPDVHASLSVGVTIDHLVSMTIPFLGGMLWERAGFQYVFVAASCIAACNFVAASFVRVRHHAPPSAEVEAEATAERVEVD